MPHRRSRIQTEEKDEERHRARATRREHSKEFSPLVGETLLPEQAIKPEVAFADPRLAHPANAARRVALVHTLQRQVGNAVVQRLVAQARQSAPIDEQLTALMRASGPGSPIPSPLREEIGGLMGVDFSPVRIHDDEPAHQSSNILNARAFTTGRDIFLGANAPPLHSSDGQSLLAHELTHVIQQASGQPIEAAGKIGGYIIGGERHELEAELVARTYRERKDHPPEAVTLQLERDPTKTTIQRDDGDVEAEPEEPITDRWLIRIAGGASVGAVVAGEVVIAEICDPETRIGAAFRYLGVGGGIGLGELQLPSPPGGVSGPSEWQEVTLPRPIRLADFAGDGNVTAAGIGVGGVGVGSTVLLFSHPARITGEYVNVEFRGAPLLSAGFTATTGSWVKSPPYPMTV